MNNQFTQGLVGGGRIRFLFDHPIRSKLWKKNMIMIFWNG
ncbi:hypothetical protein D1BOALGB6SA_6252 [Olavius sp. associated proteobacterium Delta 1]|nr:hypothetical protein D1BOALGB6SA_6252 [Olavius sp. associated proteobacterium Delta 1]